MKRLFSILLTSILLLNVFGYYGVFLGLQYQNERSITRALDAGVLGDSPAMTLKIPVSVPYMPDQSAFERVKGGFEHNGEFYRLVKQRYAKDTLTVVYIRDVEHRNIAHAISDYARTFADLPGGHQQSKITIAFLKEYLPLAFAIRPLSPGWVISFSYPVDCPELLDSFSLMITQPPEQA